MKLLRPAALLLLFGLVLVGEADATETDPLWQKAVAIGAKHWGLIPKTMHEHEKVYTEEGKLKRVTISDYETYRDEDGKVRAKLLKCVRDGKDATETKQREIDESMKRRPQDRELFKKRNDLFQPENQDRVRVERINIPRKIHGRDTVAFDYSMRGEEATMNGVVWLDAETGTPYHVVTRPDRFPENESFKIHEATLEFLFNDPSKEDGMWHVETMKVRSKIEIDIFLFFTFKGRVSAEVTLQDFHR